MNRFQILGIVRRKTKWLTQTLYLAVTNAITTRTFTLSSSGTGVHRRTFPGFMNTMFRKLSDKQTAWGCDRNFEISPVCDFRDFLGMLSGDFQLTSYPKKPKIWPLARRLTECVNLKQGLFPTRLKAKPFSCCYRLHKFMPFTLECLLRLNVFCVRW